jgi:hypothetical protein
MLIRIGISGGKEIEEIGEESDLLLCYWHSRFFEDSFLSTQLRLV